MEASALSPPAGLGRIAVSARLLRLRTDEQLVALFRAGDDEAFRTIHDRYRQRLFAYTRQMLSGSRSDAEDALQDVFLRAYHALRADGRPVTLRAWLYRVAHNRCIDQLRRPSPAPSDVFDLNRSPLHDPLAEAERREDLRRLVADVRGLPEQQRSALLMREMEGLTYAELGDALGVTIPAVKSLLVRARIGLVESIEARDTACGDIRGDLASSHDRGVRASGRARRHLRECAGCREYRAALKGLDSALGALNPGAGPLATLAKLLGIGGAGSGAAAGGTAAAGGGAAAGTAATATAGSLTTLGTGAVAATATKVAAVVAAAAVVGGGAAVEQQVRRAAPVRDTATVPTPRRVIAPLAAVATEVVLRSRRAAPGDAGLADRLTAPADPTAPATDVPTDRTAPDPAGAGSPTPADVAANSGGILAPPDTADDQANTASPDGDGPAAPTAGGPATATPPETGAVTTGHAMPTGTPGAATTAGPTGQSSGGPAPVAQGAATAP